MECMGQFTQLESLDVKAAILEALDARAQGVASMPALGLCFADLEEAKRAFAAFEEQAPQNGARAVLEGVTQLFPSGYTPVIRIYPT